MAKKRRDKERDSSSVGKIAKVGKAALSIGVGAAYFSKKGYTRKFTSEIFPALQKTKKAISTDLSKARAVRSRNKKGLKAQDIYDTYQNHLKNNNTFKKALEETKISNKNKLKLKTDYKNDSYAALIVNTHQTRYNDLRHSIEKGANAELQMKFIMNELIPKYKQYGIKELDEIAKNAFRAVDEFTLIDRQGKKGYSSFIDKHFDQANIDVITKTAILDDIVKYKNEVMPSAISEDQINSIQTKLSDILGIKSGQGKKRSDTVLYKLSSILNKATGLNVDLEEKLLNSRAFTLGDFQKHKDRFDPATFTKMIKNNSAEKNHKYETIDIVNEIEKIIKNDESAKDIILDKSIRIDKDGNIFDISEWNESTRNWYNKFASTLPGNLFGQTDVKLGHKLPTIAVMEAGSTGREAIYELGNETTYAMTSKIAIKDAKSNMADVFELRLDENNNLTLSSEPIARGLMQDNSHGKSARLYKNMIGSNKKIFNKSDDALSQLLDINQSGAPSFWQKIEARFKKGSDPEWTKNIIERNKALTTADEVKIEQRIDQLAIQKAMALGSLDEDVIFEQKANLAARILKDTKELSAMLNDHTAMYQVDDDTIFSLMAAAEENLIQDHHSKAILKALTNPNLSNSELLEALSFGNNPGDFQRLYNKDLEHIINRGLVNIDHVLHMMNISQNKPASFIKQATTAMDVRDVIRREAIKEVMLRESAEGVTDTGQGIFEKDGIRRLEQILQIDTLTQEQSDNLRYVANWGILQSNLKLYNDTDAVLKLSEVLGPNGTINQFEDLINEVPTFKAKYREMLNTMSSKYTFLDSGDIGNINETYYNEYNPYTIIKKSALSLDNLAQLESINDFIKLAGEAKDELFAGRQDLENYSNLTKIPQFAINRLVWGVEELGLGFSSGNMGSTLDVAKNIALRRVLPVMAAFSLYDYLDYESENLTGVSITGAAANTLANFDLASRKIAYSTGVGQAINWFKETSVIGEYWTGTTNFQTAEEREEWYENGYQAVRGGRFWGFGSSSEFRGSAIQYYQPNYLKRAHSNWKEIGIYGSAKEKFSHSWLPSLRHPLSPLRAALNPYWLEKKNMEDRPYPMTGKMFSEGTPWGAVLNPTIGELLKPVRTLPEVRRRLGKDGRDIRAVVENINERIKQRGNRNDDMLIVNGTDIRNASYIPYASPNDGSMNISFINGQAIAPGIGYMNGISDLREFIPANGKVNGDYDLPLIQGDTELGQAAIGITQDIRQTSYSADIVANEILTTINDAIKKLGGKFSSYGGFDNSAYATGSNNIPDLTQGTYVYQNLVNQRNVFNSNYYADNFDYKMVDKSIANNYIKDFSHSIRELTGIYNFLGELAFGEDSWTFELENANNMTSFSRHFWDAQIGSFGGELMEITRRFFAPEDKSRIKYNPLRNSMEDWLPSRFLTGDPYTELPKGEMRLPGKGYESIHDLHPDQFGEYGAFDRMKILGDVAPTSEEYKIWRNIARNTIADENLIKQMDDIEHRAQKMSSKHEFYDYRYFNNNLNTKHGVVKSWNGNIVTLVSGEQLRLGGIELTEEADLSQVLSPGQKIHYYTSKDAIKRLEDGIVTNAVIYKKDGAFGTNINKTLVDLGMAQKDDKDKTAIGYIANASTMQQTLGMVQEIIGHAPIPFIHNKYLKIETARESYANEHIYGTSFSTWDNPIKSFVSPMLNKTFGQSPLEHAVAVGSSALYFNLKSKGAKGAAKWGSAAFMATANPAALLGAGMEFGMKLGITAIGGGSNSWNIERGAKWGSVIGTIGWGLANTENPLKAATSFAVAGETLNILLDTASVVGKNGDQIFKNVHGKGAAIGAGVGLAISAIKNPGFSKEMFRAKWVPKATEKKYEIDEYFDRLTYLKNKSLYEQAAFRAGLFEGNHNLKDIFKKLDKNKEKIAKLTRKAEKLSNKHSAGGYEYEAEMQKINDKIMALQSQQTAFKGGKYTKAAVAYKKAMDSTIYGMSEGATADEILASIPVQYKDHFKAFIDERSESERKKILKQLPEYLQKPLQIAWGQKVNKVDSNRKFFREHKLPGVGWRGWKPNINLKHVKMKTIQNEGMLLSDFGYYESEKSKMDYAMAPDIDNFDSGTNTLSYLTSMTSALTGIGMTVQNISVEPTSAPGLWIVGDIKQTSKDIAKIGGYAASSGVQTLTSLLF